MRVVTINLSAIFLAGALASAASAADTSKPVGQLGGVDIRPAAPSTSNPGNRPSLGGGMIGPTPGQGPYPTNPTNPTNPHQVAPPRAPGVILTIPTK